MHSIITNFFAGLIKDHLEAIRLRAQKEGFQEAERRLRPLVDRLREELEEAKQKPALWEIRDVRPPVCIQSDPSLYGPERFPVVPEMVALMRAEVAWAVSQNLVASPTEDQWKMILSDHPATCVVAGAGSGKSTTLVLRVIFMLCHLGIRPQDMTVVSFTRESCKELRKKIDRTLSIDQWKVRLTPSDAENLDVISKTLVRTFHAALSKLAKKYFPRVIWFDMLKDKEIEAVADEDDLDNPLVSTSSLSELQLQLLQDTYRRCFSGDPVFRKHVIEMIRIECNKDLLLDDSEKDEKRIAIVKGSARDLEIVGLVNEKWQDSGWIMPGLDPTPFKAFSVDGHPFYANGKILATGMPVFLSLNGFIDNRPLFGRTDQVGQGDDAFSIHSALKVRRNIIARYFGGDKLHLKTTTGIERLAYRVRYLSGDDFQYQEAPRFEIKLNGEIAACDVVECFYGQASFIESLGMEVTQALRKMPLFKAHQQEYHFAVALARFWPAFEHHLRSMPKPVMTFNRAFLLLGEKHDRSGNQSQVDLHDLRHFTHLLVDEFQDISPQIVSWLRATQRLLSTLGRQPSLMAIGDDWQSVYGWRGSAPELFIDFGKHFPSHSDLGGARVYRMMENYRSVEPVITDAEKLLHSVKVKINKQAKSMRPTESVDHGVVMEVGVDPSANPQTIAKAIREQLIFVNELPRSDKNKVVVLCRSRKVLSGIRKVLGPLPGVSFFTFHGSKGLQGEVAILCDNCEYDQRHDFRNAVYVASGLFSQTYDQAAKDEAYRLAYVAITRGIRRVIWFLDEPRGAAQILAPTAAA